MRRQLLGVIGDEANAVGVLGANFSAGFVAGSLAAAATCPLDVAKTRRQIEVFIWIKYSAVESCIRLYGVYLFIVSGYSCLACLLSHFAARSDKGTENDYKAHTPRSLEVFMPIYILVMNYWKNMRCVRSIIFFFCSHFEAAVPNF